jgi:hypothetical protein
LTLGAPLTLKGIYMNNLDINISAQIRKLARIFATESNISNLIALLAACALIKDNKLQNSCIYFVISSMSFKS